MTVKDDFISLFKGHEAEIKQLPDRFHIRDFSYMITSQRSMEKISEKLTKIINDDLPESGHPNFWPDLESLGLVKRNPDRLSEFGKVVFAYFQNEEDSFKREHFILSNIRHRNFDINHSVHETYREKEDDLNRFLTLIPELNQPGNELLNNPEKLLITAFLNVFPYALKRYFDLSLDKQNRIDSLHERGLKTLFDPDIKEEIVYFKIARRLWNIWRANDRRINFVKSVILSTYEENINNDVNQIKFRIITRFKKLLNEEILKNIFLKSDIVQVESENDLKIIRHKFRDISHVIEINDLELLGTESIRGEGEEIVRRIVSADEQREAQERLNERTKQHEEIVKKIASDFSPEKGYLIKIDTANYDLLIENEKNALLFEVKTIKENNRPDERRQIKHAIGQLYYYEHMCLKSNSAYTDFKINKFLALQRKPIDNRHLDLLKNIGIYLIWLNEENKIDGEKDSLAVYLTF